MRFERFSVTQKLTGLILIILLASFTVHVILIVPRFKEYSLSHARTLLEEKARGVAGDIDSVLRQARRELERIAAHPDIVSMEPERVDRTLLVLDDTTASYLSFFVQDSRGIVISRPDKGERVGANRSAMDYFTAPLSTGQTVFSDFFVSPAGNLTTTVSTPVKGPDGSTRGVLVGSLGVDERNVDLFRVITEVRVGKSGYAYLVDGTGKLIAHPVGDRAPGRTGMQRYHTLSQVKDLLTGQAGSGVYELKDSAWVVAYSPVRTSGWGVVVQQPVGEIPNFSGALLAYFLSIFAGTLIVSSALSIVFVRRLLRPLRFLATGVGETPEGSENRGDGDEIQFLSSRIGEMVNQVQRSEEELKKINLELKEEVAQRKAAEEDLSFNLAILDAQLERSPDGVLVVDTGNRIILSNQRFRELWRIPQEVMETRSDEPVLNFAVSRASDPEAFLERVKYLYKNPQERGHEHISLDDGRVLERFSEPMIGVDGTHYGRVWYFRDVTEQKRSEEEMRTSLLEKDTLLKEVHHRVKNNLQAVAGILDLQAAGIRDEETLGLFRVSRNRITTMALLHEKLYQSKDQSRVNLREYISDLTDYLLHTMSGKDKPVRITPAIQDVTLNLDTAIPCGLIVTELVSNALKHAYPEPGEGEIVVEIKAAGEDSYRMVIRDNGVGLPEELDLDNLPSLGLQLVRALVQQLSGTLEIHSNRGTVFDITFREYSEYQGVL